MSEFVAVKRVLFEKMKDGETSPFPTFVMEYGGPKRPYVLDNGQVVYLNDSQKKKYDEERKAHIEKRKAEYEAIEAEKLRQNEAAKLEQIKNMPKPWQFWKRIKISYVK